MATNTLYQTSSQKPSTRRPQFRFRWLLIGLLLVLDIDGLEVSHLAFRTVTLAEYLTVRQKLESICSANVENIWNGKPISKLLLQDPLELSRNATTSLIELIPPVYQSVYKMGLEHVGLVIGETFADFGKLYSHSFTGQ
jgi:predicted metalloenzyme YecM